MKKIFISIITILTILLLLSSFAYASNYIRPTLSDVKMLLEASTDYKSISKLNDSTLQITDDVDGLNQPITVNLYYDSSNDIFYTEEVFDNSMDNDTISAKYSLVLQLPINAFSTVAQKNDVSTLVNSTYTLEKSMEPLMYSNIAVSTMLETSPTDKVTSLDTLIDKDFEDSTNIDCEYFTTKLEKTTTDSSITIKNTLTIKTEADFSKMADYSEDLKKQKEDLENARNNADYKIYLKPTENYTVSLDEKQARGFSQSNIFDSCISISMENNDFIFSAKKSGEEYGTLTFADGIDENGKYIGKVEKTYYVEVSTIDISLDTNTVKNDINNVTINNSISGINKNNTITSNNSATTLYNSTINNNKNSVVNMPKNSVVSELPNAGINTSAINTIKIILSLTILALIIFTGYNISRKKDN